MFCIFPTFTKVLMKRLPTPNRRQGSCCQGQSVQSFVEIFLHHSGQSQLKAFALTPNPTIQPVRLQSVKRRSGSCGHGQSVWLFYGSRGISKRFLRSFYSTLISSKHSGGSCNTHTVRTRLPSCRPPHLRCGRLRIFYTHISSCVPWDFLHFVRQVASDRSNRRYFERLIHINHSRQ